MSTTVGQHIEGLLRKFGLRPRKPVVAANAPAVPVAGATLANSGNVERKYMESLLDRAHPAKARPVMSPVNGVSVQQEGDALEQMLKKYESASVVAETLERPDVLALTAHVRRPDEGMSELYARTGIGRAQILSMSKDEIRAWVEVAEENERQNERGWRPAEVA